MKTTLELPDELYRQAKTRASSQNRKIKDLVSEGLRVVLTAHPATSADDVREKKRVLDALDDILRCPPLPAGRIASLQSEVRRLRSEGWSRERAVK
ncbi:MAG: hypothetical protein WCH98_07045 [Verrucomicrobiota bacterium]